MSVGKVGTTRRRRASPAYAHARLQNSRIIHRETADTGAYWGTRYATATSLLLPYPWDVANFHLVGTQSFDGLRNLSVERLRRA